MKLSFVIPAHNEEQYIGKCLDSILAAIGNNPDIEVIVVNNNSTDKTREIAARYPKVVIIDEKKPGANSARQAGYLASKGELIANVDADTILTPGWIFNALTAFKEDPKLICLSGPFIFYDLPRGMRILVKAFYALSFLAYLLTRYILRRSSVVQGENFVVRRSALDAIGGHNTELTFYGDDADLACRLNKIGKVRFTFSFPIYSSGRRLATEGTFTMGLRYGVNYFWIVFFNRPFTQTSIAVRPEQKDGKLTYRPAHKTREIITATALLTTLFAFLVGFVYLGYILIQSGIISATATARIKMETQKIEDNINTLGKSIQNKLNTP